MLFHSMTYLLLFFPVAALGAWALRRRGAPRRLQLWLVSATVYFFALWGRGALLIMVVSVLTNFIAGCLLTRAGESRSRRTFLLAAAVCFNVGLLGYFKYAGFAIGAVNSLFNADIAAMPLLLPVAISFYTFQQLSFVVDCYRGSARCERLLDYLAYVCFFPYLISGPICRWHEVAGQLKRPEPPPRPAVAGGMLLMAMGLCKKVLLADTLAVWANAGFAATEGLQLLDAWAASLAFTLQLYFDFSGYTDMAIGSALMLGITLPANFDSPYRAGSIREFWGRWHMTLSRFLRDYIYIPLGGSRGGAPATVVNIMLTMLLCGLWHGAGWTFVAWGALHGAGLTVHRLWHTAGLRIARPLAVCSTFLFVNACWVFFRAETFADAFRVLRAMAGGNGTGGQVAPDEALVLAVLCVLVFCAGNSQELARRLHGSRRVVAIVFLAALGMLQVLNQWSSHSAVSEFLYFRF